MSEAGPFVMSDEEKYYFDLQGYLVVRGALSTDDVRACNDAIDHHAGSIRARPVEGGGLARGSAALTGGSGRRELRGMLGWPAPYRQPFRDLLVHPVVVSRLNEMCGRGFRLDHGPLLIGAEAGTEGHLLHGAGEPFSPANWYHHQNSVISCRGVTVAWQLTDVGEGDGGFAVVPGSHKSREPTPAGGCAPWRTTWAWWCSRPWLPATSCSSPRPPPTAPCRGRARANGVPSSTSTPSAARPGPWAATSSPGTATGSGRRS